MKLIISFSLPLIATFLLTPLLIKLANKAKVLDYPAKRKIHKNPTPLLGGLAIYVGMLIGIIINYDKVSFFMPIFLCATVILIIGLIDDVRGLSANFRIISQIAIVLYVIASGLRVSFLPSNIFGDIGEIVITLIWIVGVINAFNYLDGIDGLATGSAVLNLICFAVILFGLGQEGLGLLVIIFIGSCLGFLPFNIKNAKIFLGDAGSTFLGFLLACIAVEGNWAEDNVVKLAIPVLILGVPIFDMVFTTVMRIKEEKVKNLVGWLKYAGKDHFHHYLVSLGLHQTGAMIFIYFVNLSLGISAIMLSNDNAVEALLTISQSFIIFGIIATLIVMGKRRHPVIVK